MAIGIKLKKARRNADPGRSKFFGDPVVPHEWTQKDWEDLLFFCQIRLEDLDGFSEASGLPERGYYYIFLKTSVYPYEPLVLVYEREPDAVLEHFNSYNAQFDGLEQSFEMSFYKTKDYSKGTRLFGVPYNWSYGIFHPDLFLQFDPKQDDTGFMDHIDGMLFFFMHGDPTNLSLHTERY